MPELVSGIELTANGQKVAWSIAEYLATLEKSAGELLHDDAKPEAEGGGQARAEGGSQAQAEGGSQARAEGGSQARK